MSIRIGIPHPTSFDLSYNRTCWPQYAQAVEGAGGEAVLLELATNDAALQRMLAACDGFVLPGSPADVDPARYGEAASSGTARADAARESLDGVLLGHAAETGKPILAICFGMQDLNVWLGGSLVQDVTPVPVNHGAGPQVAVAHSVGVASESLLASLLGPAEAPAGVGGERRLAVNSSHHQALARVGRGLAVVGISVEDGVIEAVEGRLGEAAVVGLQWHPERSVAISAASRALFQWLIAEAEDRCQGSTLEGAFAGHR